MVEQVDAAALSLEQRLALAEQMLITLLGVVQGLRGEVEAGVSGPQDSGGG